MALWRIDRANGQVSLSYIERPHDAHPTVKDCGRSDDTVLPDLTGFVCQQADPFDMLRMPDGSLFFRQPARDGRFALLQ
jgi:hypothetical protein